MRALVRPGDADETPLPELAAGDRLLAFAELELTTDAEDPNHPGRSATPTRTRPRSRPRCCSPPTRMSSRQSLARRSSSAEGPGARRSATGATTRWSRSATPSCASPPAGCRGRALASRPRRRRRHPDARPGDVLLVGQTRRRRPWSRTWRGSGSSASVPANPGAGRERQRHACARPSRSPSSRPWSSHTSSRAPGRASSRSSGARLVTDATGLAEPARISTRMFIGRRPDQTEPGGAAADSVTWKGHLSKFTGFNCLPDEGPRPRTSTASRPSAGRPSAAST